MKKHLHIISEQAEWSEGVEGGAGRRSSLQLGGELCDNDDRTGRDQEVPRYDGAVMCVQEAVGARGCRT